MYSVPEEYFVRLHHCRPRFKNDIENVLLYIASEICAIGEKPEEEFSLELVNSIKLFPGNASKTIKTLNNWRTEISSLLGLIEFTTSGFCRPSAMARILAEKQDLIEFFRFFCFKFQYPGGHLKVDRSLEMIKLGVRFKPVKYLLNLLIEGARKNKKSFGISKAEATHCVFNDLRVCRDERPPLDTLGLILSNRDKNVEYDFEGDVVRYAGDILDYMVLANLVTVKPDGKYYPKTNEIEVLHAFMESEEYFPSYENLYKKEDIHLSDVSNVQINWFLYVNENLNQELFESNVLHILEDASDTLDEKDSFFITSLLNSLRKKQKQNGKLKTLEIGNVGESITILHEQLRLISLDRQDLAKKVVKMPENLSAGYDINSFEGNAEIKRVIEVKTTISKNKLNISRFHLTPNEWGAADTFKQAYYIYRLMISTDSVSLFVIQDPVGQYKSDRLDMTPRNGADITYNNSSGQYVEVLTQ
jgi:hypothetical protein